MTSCSGVSNSVWASFNVFTYRVDIMMVCRPKHTASSVLAGTIQISLIVVSYTRNDRMEINMAKRPIIVEHIEKVFINFCLLSDSVILY